MSRVILLGAVGVAVIIAALTLNYAITRDDAPDRPSATLQSEQPDKAGEAPQSAGEEGVGSALAVTDGPADRAGPIRPDFDVVQVSPTGGVVIAGRAAPGSEITVLQNGRPMGSVTADRRGEWVLVPDKPIEPGNHELGLRSELPGVPPVESEDVVVVVVPENRGDGRQEGARQPLALALPRDGQGGATVFQKAMAAEAPARGGATEPGEGIADGNLVLDSVTYGDAGGLTVGGRAKPGARVRVFIGDRRIGTTVADAAGRWEVTSDAAVPEGLHSLRVEVIGPDRNVVERVESPFQRTAMQEAPADGVIVIQPGNNLWRIARRMYGRGVQYTLIFEANRSKIEDPDLIYPGQVFVLPPIDERAD